MSWLSDIGDWAGSLTGSDILSGVGKAAGLAGTLANTFGGDTTPRQNGTPEGFQSLYNTGNPEFTDFVKNDVLQMIMNASRQPRVGRPMRRLTSADMQGAFAPQAAYALQNYGDEQAAMQAAQQQAEQETQAQAAMRPAADSAASEVALRRQFETDPNDMSAAAKEKRRQLYNMNVALQNFQDGQVNPVTGEKFQKQRFLDFLQSQSDSELMNPRNSLGFNSMTAEQRAPMDAEREALYRQTFIPSKSKQSFLGRFGAPLLLAAMTAGAGAAGVPAFGANALKGAVTGARTLTGN